MFKLLLDNERVRSFYRNLDMIKLRKELNSEQYPYVGINDTPLTIATTKGTAEMLILVLKFKREYDCFHKSHNRNAKGKHWYNFAKHRRDIYFPDKADKV